jgi:hypothetical protein
VNAQRKGAGPHDLDTWKVLKHFVYSLMKLLTSVISLRCETDSVFTLPNELVATGVKDLHHSFVDVRHRCSRRNHCSAADIGGLMVCSSLLHRNALTTASLLDSTSATTFVASCAAT